VTVPGAPRDEFRLRAPRNPLRLAVSGSLWRSAWFLIVYVFAAGWILFAAGLTASAAAVCCAVTIAGFPVLIGAAGVLRGCAAAERARLGAVFTQPVHGRYRPATGQGIVARTRAMWDGATWRDLAYVVGLWIPLCGLDVVVVTVWLTFLAGITLPLWYWAPRATFHGGLVAHGVQFGYFPNGPNGPGGHGFYADTLPKALLVAAISLAAFLLFNYVVVATARMHGRVARGLLRAPADPLAEARAVLAEPGPLESLTR